MKRRDFIMLLGGAAAWPLAARAQQAERTRRVGVLVQGRENPSQPYIAAFREELAKLGWIEGRNLRIDLRFAVARPRSYPGLRGGTGEP
jgi:putative ABC transport system substrate-binding protein